MLPAITVQLLARKPKEGAPSGADGSGTLESAGGGWAIKNNLVWEQKASITAVSSTLYMDAGERTFWVTLEAEKKQTISFYLDISLSNGLKGLINLI